MPVYLRKSSAFPQIERQAARLISLYDLPLTRRDVVEFIDNLVDLAVEVFREAFVKYAVPRSRSDLMIVAVGFNPRNY